MKSEHPGFTKNELETYAPGRIEMVVYCLFIVAKIQKKGRAQKGGNQIFMRRSLFKKTKFSVPV